MESIAGQKGFCRDPQVNHPIDAKFSNSLVRPVYLLNLPNVCIRNSKVQEYWWNP